MSTIEARGIDFIPPAERHGRPRSLFWVWTSANVIYLYFVYGGLLMLLGLGVWEALAICVVGNLWWIAVGYIAISGPAAGTPSVMIMRALFGVRGNLVYGAGLGVLIGLFFVVLNVTFAALAGLAVLDRIGLGLAPGAEWIVLLVIALASFGVSVFGHGAILRLSPWFSAALALCFLVLGIFVVGGADLGYVAPELPVGEHIALVLLGLTVIASGPLSWGSSSDFSRYLPQSASRSGVLWATALGGLIPSVLIAALGVLAGTAIDMTDPQTSVAVLVPAWFHLVFLVVIVLGSVANNVLTAYSTALYTQALGVPVKRWVSTVLTGVVATALSAYLLFGAPRFLDTLNYAIEIAVAVLGPLVAVYVVDILLRRNRYDGVALNDSSRRSPFWCRGGVFWPGMIAMTVATAVAVLMVNTTLYQGPIAVLLGGADPSSIAGPVLAGGLYAALWRVPAFQTRPSRSGVGSEVPTTDPASGSTEPALPTDDPERISA